MKKRHGLQICLTVGVMIILVLITTTIVIVMNNEKKTVDKEIPVLRINLNQVTLDEIKQGDKGLKYGGNELIIENNNEKSVFEDIIISGRGNSTWQNKKKPFNLKLSDKENLFGMGKSKKWVLLANHFDDTHLRNEAAFEFWNMMDENLKMKEEPVEVYIDEEYEGLYYLTRKIEISKSMVGLRDLNGIIVELDNINTNKDECTLSSNNNCLIIKDAVYDKNKDEALRIFLEKFNAFEKASEAKDWTTIQKVCDVDSLAKYFLVSEFSSNPDAYVSSMYFYMDGKDDKIHAGPIWDYDFAFANERWSWGRNLKLLPNAILPMKSSAFGSGVYVSNGEYKKREPNLNISRMFYWLEEMEEFRNVVSKWVDETIAGKKGEYLNELVSRAKNIRNVVERNNEKWELKHYKEETEKLLWWIFQRYDFIEKEYGS